MKFPVFSLLAGNLAFSETSSQLTPPSSGESANFRFLYDRSEPRQSRFRRGDAPVVSSSLRQYIGDPALERDNRAPARHRSAPHRHQAKVSSATSSGLSSSPGLCCGKRIGESAPLRFKSGMKRRDAAPRPATTASSCGSSFADDRCVGPPNLIAAKITDWSIPKVPCREQPRHRQEPAGPGRRFR
jgi:hypothetical protein